MVRGNDCTKISQNGRSQAVRLPKACRFGGRAVKISKEGDKVILEPFEGLAWPEGLWDDFSMDQEFRTPEALSSEESGLD